MNKYTNLSGTLSTYFDIGMRQISLETNQRNNGIGATLEVIDKRADYYNNGNGNGSLPSTIIPVYNDLRSYSLFDFTNFNFALLTPNDFNSAYIVGLFLDNGAVKAKLSNNSDVTLSGGAGGGSAVDTVSSITVTSEEVNGETVYTVADQNKVPTVGAVVAYIQGITDALEARLSGNNPNPQQEEEE